MGKECFVEEFRVELGNVKKGRRMVVKKTVASTLDRVKKKILGKEVKGKEVMVGDKVILLTRKTTIKS